jgi:hypothetical protein
MPGAPPPSPSRRVLYGDLVIGIDRDGVRHYHGSPIRRKELLCSLIVTVSDEHQSDEHPRHLLAAPPSGEVGPYVVPDERPEARLPCSVRCEPAAPGVEAESEGRHCRGVRSGGRMFALGWLDEAS